MNRLGSRAAVAVLGIAALAGCGSTAGGGGALGDMLLFAGSTVPPMASAPSDNVYCPTVGVMDGGAALQVYSGGRVGDASALRSQITLGQLARECNGQPDGSTLVKVGVEGRALIGAAAGTGGGRYDVPVRIVVKKGSTVVASRARRIAVAVPAGESQASFIVVEEGIMVPPDLAQDFEIEVGLGGAVPEERGRRRG